MDMRFATIQAGDFNIKIRFSGLYIATVIGVRFFMLKYSANRYHIYCRFDYFMTAVLLNFNAIILLQSSCFDSAILYNFMVAVAAIISQWRQIHIPNAPNMTKTTQTGTYQHMSANVNAFKWSFLMQWLESTEKNTIKAELHCHSKRCPNACC